MKRLLSFAPLLLLAALLLSPTATLAGAKRGLDIWWGHVFPALLPIFICVRLSQQMGLLRLASRHPRGQLAAVISFSLISGAPNGAKLLHALAQDGVVSTRDGSRLLPLVNSISPAFLLSIIASELLKNKGLFLPMAAAFYGCILFFLFLRIPRKKVASLPVNPSVQEHTSFSEALSSAIENSMLDMLRIGGCILFVCSLLAVIQQKMPDKAASAFLAVCMEVSTGAAVLAKLAMPLRWKVSLMSGAAAFGGLSLALQTLCCYPELKLIPYLLKKLTLGILVGAVCYLLFPLFPSVAQVFASRQEVFARSRSLSALLLSSILSLVFMGLFSIMIASKNRNG